MSSARLGASVLLVIFVSVVVWAGALSGWDAASIAVVVAIVAVIGGLFLTVMRNKKPPGVD